MIALLLVLQAQRPAPTVGDTVWAARTVYVPAGAVVRPAPWPDDAESPVQSLGPPSVERHGDSLTIRYPLVAWTPGEHPVEIPGPMLLGPGAAMDSLPSEATTLFIANVVPDTVDADSVPPQPPAQIVGDSETSWAPLLEFALLGGALAAAVIRLGRRRARPAPEAPAPLTATANVVRWAGDGELRAAQAGARARLRQAIARAVPAAAERLDIESCLAALRLARPEWPLLELEGLLTSLDAERFAPGQGDPDLVERAERLRVQLERAG